MSRKAYSSCASSSLRSSKDTDEIAKPLEINEYVNKENMQLLRDSKRLQSLTNDKGESMFKSYIRYFDMAELLGHVPVTYKLDEDGLGRYKSSVSDMYSPVDDSGLRMFVPTLATMKREVRGLLASENYIDVDFVNCNPSILAQVLERNHIEAPCLMKYNEKRTHQLSQICESCNVDIAAGKKGS
jgi:hypothetical protein